MKVEWPQQIMPDTFPCRCACGCNKPSIIPLFGDWTAKHRDAKCYDCRDRVHLPVTLRQAQAESTRYEDVPVE